MRRPCGEGLGRGGKRAGRKDPGRRYHRVVVVADGKATPGWWKTGITTTAG